MNILLIDDERYLLEELKESVSAVLPAASIYAFQRARPALKFAQTTPIDIAFLDIRMKVMDGLTMARHLQEMYPKLNIIFCTGYESYSMEAHGLFCSGYLLKPVTEEKVRLCLTHLRYPLKPEHKSVVRFRCFGNFEVYYEGTPIHFYYRKTKELLAYLVDRNGADCSIREISAVLFEDETKRSYFNQLRQDLISSFKEIGIADILSVKRGFLGIKREMVSCDYFDYLDSGSHQSIPEYMTQYSFAESTLALLNHEDI